MNKDSFQGDHDPNSTSPGRPSSGYGPAGYYAAHEPAPEFDFLEPRALLAVIKRRKFMIIGITFLVTAVAAIVVSQLTPLYRAEAEIVIEPDRANVLDIDEVAEGLSRDWRTTLTEAEVLQSRKLAREVVMRNDLIDDPHFNPWIAPPKKSFFETTWLLAQDWLARLGILEAKAKPEDKPDLTRPAADVSEDRQIHVATSIVQRGIGVYDVPGSRVLGVTFTSTDPRVASRIANEVVQVYIQQQLSEKGNITETASTWLEQRVAEQQEKLIESEQKLEDYRRENGLTQIDGSLLPVRQITQFNAQLITSRAALADLQTRSRQVDRLLQNGTDDISAAAAVLNNALIQNLRVQEITLNRRIAELSTQYRDGHPKMILARAEIKDLKEKIQDEVRRIAANLKNEVEVARAKVRNLESEIDKLQQQVAGIHADGATLRSLEVEVMTNRELYETLLQRMKETGFVDDTIHGADARVISQATTPGRPFYPKKRIIIGMAFAVSLAGAIFLALVIEFFDAGFRSLSQIEKQTGLPTLGMIPSVKVNTRGEPLHLQSVRKQGTIFSEAIRTIRTSLMLSNSEKPPKLVLVTSSVPNEGKTSTVLSLAAQTAHTGRSCIVVDCDIRQAALAKAVDVKTKSGLCEYLTGKAKLEDIIGVDEDTSMHYIAAGGSGDLPVDMLGSSQMFSLLQALSETYQMVFLDTPPLLAVSDAMVLLRRVDAVVYLVRWETTKRDTAKSGLKIALEAGAPLAGVALTQVNIKRHAQYHYADSGHYYNKSYQKYYTEG